MHMFHSDVGASHPVQPRSALIILLVGSIMGLLVIIKLNVFFVFNLWVIVFVVVTPVPPTN